MNINCEHYRNFKLILNLFLHNLYNKQILSKALVQIMPVYAVYLLIFFFIPVVMLFLLLRTELARYKRTLFWCFVFIYTIGVLWDWLSVRTGVWRYDSAPTLGIWIDGLPAEEFIGFNILGTFLIFGGFLVIRKILRNV
jgi:lycopene cyclase domain-containing protein